MGLLSKLKSKSPSNDTASTYTENSTAPLDPSSSTSEPGAVATETTTDQPRKKSLYEKYRDRKRGPGLSDMTDEDLLKYTGKTRAEFDQWKETAPGVAGGQSAGSLTAGGVGGLGVTGAAEGRGGWGYEAGKVPSRDGERVVR